MGLLFGMVLPCGLGLGLGCAALDFALGLALATAFLGDILGKKGVYA